MKKHILAALAAAGILSSSTSAWANTYVVTEKNKVFSTASLTIKVGDSVEFKNDDTVYHNVFSLSDAMTFDLGSYGPGESRKLKFDKAGTVEVECAIHHTEKLKIAVR